MRLAHQQRQNQRRLAQQTQPTQEFHEFHRYCLPAPKVKFKILIMNVLTLLPCHSRLLRYESRQADKKKLIRYHTYQRLRQAMATPGWGSRVSLYRSMGMWRDWRTCLWWKWWMAPAGIAVEAIHAISARFGVKGARVD